MEPIIKLRLFMLYFLLIQKVLHMQQIYIMKGKVLFLFCFVLFS